MPLGESVADLKQKQVNAQVNAGGTLQPQPVTLPAGVPLLRVSTADTNLAAWRAGSTALQELTVSNLSASPIFVKLYNKATAPVLATDIPLVVIPVAANSFLSIEFGNVGKRFALGVGLAITGAAPVTDATTVGAGCILSATYV